MAKTKTHSFPCSFKGFGSNKGSARLSIEFGRCEMEIDDALEMLVNSEHRVTLVADPNGKDDANGQATMVDGRMQLQAVGRMRGFGVRKDELTASVNMSSAGLDMNLLAKIANAKGTITLDRIGDIPETKRGDGKDEPEEADDE